MQLSENEFQLLRKFLLRETGIDVPEAKQYLFSTRLGELLQKEGCGSFSDFLVLLTGGRESLIRSTIEAMTTHESGFYRDPFHFQTLVEQILPALALQKVAKRTHKSPCIRILSAGCSYGQEPYTLAMSISNWQSSNPEWTAEDFSITGIDISTRALERARQGRYTDMEIGHNLPIEDRERYFSKNGDQWTLAESLRKRVTFQHVNLSRPIMEMGRFDIIFCRNMIIYFSPEQKTAVLLQLRKILEPAGMLFLGSSESMYGTNVEFLQRTHGKSFYYQAPQPHPSNEVLSWKF
jgi:chemotaxis protein methyltransferase CheR